MKQFILREAPDAGGKVYLSGKDYHYLVRVRRLAAGSVFNALLPGGAQGRVRVLAVDKGCLIGECLSSDESVAGIDAPVLPPVYLFQALPKGAKMDLIVRQAAEGGVAAVVPFVSGHGVPRPASGETEGRMERWRRIIREARQQSGSMIPTVVEPPRTAEELLVYWEELRNRYPQALGLIFHQTPLEQGTFHGYLNKDPDLVAALIGPEGGFSPEEVVRFKAADFKPLMMGNTVLRVETAALYAAAVIRIILWERASWMPKMRT